MASAVAPAGSLQPPAAPLLLPTRPLRLGSSAAVRPALRDPAELRRGATPEEEALVADSRLDMALRRAARRTSHVVFPRLCSTGRGVGEALLPPASSPASPRRAHWSPRLGGGAFPAWPIALAVTWPPGPVRLLVLPSLRTSHLGAWDKISTVPRNSRSSRTDGAGLRSGAGGSVRQWI